MLSSGEKLGRTRLSTGLFSGVVYFSFIHLKRIYLTKKETKEHQRLKYYFERCHNKQTVHDVLRGIIILVTPQCKNPIGVS